MTDRELLELAAKAAGIELDCTIRPDGKAFYHSDRNAFAVANGGWFSPLTDDGDALRLAVKLRFQIHIWKGNIWMALSDDGKDQNWLSIEPISNDDANAATRRAIVRAAAEIGKTK
ncbi:MAG TPA: hypothetical protein VFM18_08335 [Methanosarcina sp.]|nr:hypothetical protein [Methanosarcina sp.]